MNSSSLVGFSNENFGWKTENNDETTNPWWWGNDFGEFHDIEGAVVSCRGRTNKKKREILRQPELPGEISCLEICESNKLEAVTEIAPKAGGPFWQNSPLPGTQEEPWMYMYIYIYTVTPARKKNAKNTRKHQKKNKQGRNFSRCAYLGHLIIHGLLYSVFDLAS